MEPLDSLRVSFLPDYIEAVASLLHAATDQELSGGALGPAQQLLTVLLCNFPKLEAKYHCKCVQCVHVLVGVAAPMQPGFVDAVVRQCALVALACKPAGITDADLDGSPGEATTNELRTSQFDELWTLLLDGTTLANNLRLRELGIDPRVVSNSIRDALVQCWINVIEDIDLSQLYGDIEQRNDSDDSSRWRFEVDRDVSGAAPDSEMSIYQQPTKQQSTTLADCIIFENLTGMITAFVLRNGRFLDADQLESLCSKIVVRSLQQSDVAGFYKMMSALAPLALEKCQESCDAVRKMVVVYTIEALQRWVGSRDELFTCVASFVLALPAGVIGHCVRCDRKTDHLNSLAKLLVACLRLGQSFSPLGALCLSAMLKWFTRHGGADVDLQCTVQQKRDILVQTLPHVYAYVIAGCDSGSEIQLNDITSKWTKNAAAKKAHRFKWNSQRLVSIYRNLWDSRQGGVRCAQGMVQGDPDKVTVHDCRRLAVQLLARLGTKWSKFAVPIDVNALSVCNFRWYANVQPGEQRAEIVPLVRYNAPWPDIRAGLNFDDLLPMMVAAAEGGGSRRARAAACELLHSTTVLALGAGGTATAADAAEKMAPVFGRLLPVLMRLAASTDEIPRQLFQTLMTQIIHWFSSGRASLQPYANILQETIMASLVCDWSGSSGRQYAAECLHEFLRWSVRQAAGGKLAVRLLGAICTRASHCDRAQRRAAAVAVNTIYPTLREQVHLMDIYAFECLMSLLKALAAAQPNSAEGSSNEDIEMDRECSAAVRHFSRVIFGTAKEKSPFYDTLLTLNQERKVPSGWQSATIADCVRFLFDAATYNQKERRFWPSAVRRECWHMLSLAYVRDPNILHDIVGKIHPLCDRL